MITATQIMKALSLCALGIALTACAAASKKSDTYVNSAGTVTYIENDRESCTRSCNVEFDRCGDTSAAQSRVGNGQLTGVFGAQADCRADMKTCLARCK